MYIQNRLGLIEATETMMAQTRRLNQITNTLANVDTTGYKREDVTFWEMMYQTDNEVERVGKAIHDVTNLQEGSYMQTSNPLDLAIHGNGYFKVQTPNGERLTRAGQFAVNTEQQLATQQGYLVLAEGAPITINGTDVAVSKDGYVSVDGTLAGVIEMVTAANLEDLQKEGSNLFKIINGGAEEPAIGTTISQGYLEKSNVSSMTEMTAMLDLHRAYEAQQKIVSSIDDLDSKAISRVGKLNV
ncbi:MAG: flagellar basal-body rod protein FlgF [Spirochaetales bacterium]|jgi:flagellar basal-body rod protein FlgF|nr:flagellar basal-body rod protein FlgF [Spirochaetales bacterium]